eukprot:s2488_g2.t1
MCFLEGCHRPQKRFMHAQLGNLGGSQTSKVKKVLTHFAFATQQSQRQMAFSAWRGAVEQGKADKELREMNEQMIAEKEMKLRHMKARCKAMVIESVEKMTQHDQLVMQQQWLMQWKREVDFLKKERKSQEQLNKVLNRVYTVAKKQAEKATSVMTRRAKERETDLLSDVITIWRYFLQELQKPNISSKNRNFHLPMCAVAFGWQAPRKRLRTAPEVHKDLGTAFAACEDDIEDDELEFSPSKVTGQLEDAALKLKRLKSEGTLLAEAERFAEALQHWEEALLFTEDPCDKAPILEQMAQVLLILERPFDAIRTGEQAVQSRAMSAKLRHGANPLRRHRLLVLLAFGAQLTAFCGAPMLDQSVRKRLAAASGGVEVSGDAEMLKKLKEWKKTRGSKGFADKAPAKEPEVPPPAPEPEPAPARLPRALEAVSELLQRGQEEVSPNDFTPQQLIRVFYAFFQGWRQRHGLPELELNTKQQQLVVLCAELGSPRDPEAKELLLALTGVFELPLWYAGHLTLGRALINFGELERAVESFRRAKTLLSQDMAAANDKTADTEDEFQELCLELREAETLWAEVKERAKQNTSNEVIVNGRVVESHFWQTALKVTYDSDGRPTTHFPSDTMGTPNAA